jgi:hypothetical protein
MFDHFAVEYSYPDGTRMLAQGRHMPSCWGFFGDVVHGTKGSAVLGEGIPDPRIYDAHVGCRDYTNRTKKSIWQYEGSKKGGHQVEHDVLFEAIRQDRPHNETQRSAYAAMTGILGRMAAESGKEITWEEALASDIELAPGLEKIESLDAPAPVTPDADGRYPVAVPGFTKVL